MSVTLGDLVAEVESMVYSYFNDRDKVTTLTASCNTTDLTLSVAEPAQIDRGFVEIDNELLAVQTKNETASTVTVFPWGRGQRGTTAAAHSLNARVAVNPRFPRARIRGEINNTIQNLYPDLFSAAVDATNTANPAVTTYALPATTEGVLKVQWQSVGPEGLWVPVRRYRFDYSADTTQYATGKTIDILEAMHPGRTVQVVYRAAFGQLDDDTDTLASAGVDDSWRDLIKLGTAATLLMGLDSARLNTTSVEASSRDSAVPVGAGSALARQLMQSFQIRLAQERSLLLQRYPATISYQN